MKSIEQLTEIIFEPQFPQTKLQQKAHAEQSIKWFIDDLAKVIKNINETSFNESDRVKRLIELEEKFGIPKTHFL